MEYASSYINSIGCDKTELLQITNCMFTNGSTMAQPAQGHVVCVQKKTYTKQIEDHRPLTLLHTDYKILARVIANRLKSIYRL